MPCVAFPFMTNEQTTTAPPEPPRLNPHARILLRNVGLGVLALVVAIVALRITRSSDDSSPSQGTEVCAFIRNPANDDLDTGAMADALDESEDALRNYVHRNCPELDWRVD